MKKGCYFAVFVLLPLAAGLLVYLLFRPHIPVLSDIMRIGTPIIHLDCLPELLRNFLLYYLPDGLWTFALVAGVHFITESIRLSCLIAMLTVVLFELFQRLNIVRGTGDLLDILISGVAVLLYIMIQRRFYHHGEKD